MCIIFIYTNPNPQPGTYRLVLASNRDEYYVRPAETASLCPETQIIAGKDLEPTREGGQWLGVSLKKTDGCKCRVGALLNIPGEEKKEGLKFRGSIVKDYLEGKRNTADYVGELYSRGEFRPHNLVTIELSEDECRTYHNCSIPSEGLNVFVGEQVLGFGNCTVDLPTLKVRNGVKRFAEIVEKWNRTQEKDSFVGELLRLLKWDQKHLPDEEIKKRNPLAFEELSSVFVKIVPGGYGTRAHTVVLVDSEWNVEFVEVAMEEPIDPEAPVWNTKVIRAQL